MSFYATISGSIHYERQEDFDAALQLLKSGKWVNDNGCFVDETNETFGERPDIDHDARNIRIPLGYHRNLAHHLDELFRGGTGKVVWTSTDGVFEGGVIVDGKKTSYDLTQWGREKVLGEGEEEPDAEENFDEYCKYQSEVEGAFHAECDV
jgi:hypothetical protein